jgi:hypothetical protein
MLQSLSLRRRPRAFALAVVALTLGLASTALAALPAPADDGAVDSASDTHGHLHQQHGEDSGHLNPVMTGDLELVGRMRINQDQAGRASDVAVLGNHAYVGAFSDPNCQKGGVYVFDIRNPARPKQINFIRTGGNSYVGEGVQAISVNTSAFRGDLLVMNNEICGPVQPSTVGGVTFVDVTDPKNARILSNVGDLTPAGANGPGIAHASHSAFMWQQGSSAYAVIIDNEESRDLDILDITNPRNPRLIAEYDLNAQFPQIVDGVKGAGESFSHDMVVEQIDGRWYMLASYWDGGYVILDVTDPRNPTYVGDSDFEAVDRELLESAQRSEVDEGNAHQAEWTADREFIVGADEDFAPYGTSATADGVAFEGAASGSDTPPLEEGTTISGDAVFVGRGCTGDAIHSAQPGQIAVVERGACTFTEKVANIEAAGDPDAIIVFNRTGSDACTGTGGMSVAGSTPTFGIVGRDTGFGFFGADYDDAACRAGNGTQLAPIDLGTVGSHIVLESYYDGWGYVRLFDAQPGADGKLELLDTYAIDEAHDEDFAEGFGDLSVHEVATSHRDGNILYFAYYSGGVRVAEIVEDAAGTRIEETASFIDVGGSNFWGVQVWQPTSGPYAGDELFLASDRDYGVYIFRYAGAND